VDKVVRKLIEYRVEKDPETKEKIALAIFNLIKERLNGERTVKVEMRGGVCFADKVEMKNSHELVFIRDIRTAVDINDIRVVEFYADY